MVPISALAHGLNTVMNELVTEKHILYFAGIKDYYINLYNDYTIVSDLKLCRLGNYN